MPTVMAPLPKKMKPIDIYKTSTLLSNITHTLLHYMPLLAVIQLANRMALAKQLLWHA